MSSDPSAIPDGVIDTGAKAGEELINSGPLGALVVILLIAVGLLIWLIYKSKNAHIEDKNTMIQLMNSQSIEVQGLLKDHKVALDNVQRECNTLATNVGGVKDSIGTLTNQLQIWQVQIGHSQNPRG